ncbi:adenylyl-sulfate kinase [Vibrio sp. La 4.2.2]|uniref:adenylyl-sulfate kinase n=1 Tax=Vibrio sp. La 4.2.2 TaxID=2998830 RepID=UPI0022CDD201|nr:adenylyl-sulfate kinase [Vibrio sp. La 4.2.2]MDA0110542.1 adenylyl-sulfate kinase [Vibrio sp. La 4.2.2]
MNNPYSKLDNDSKSDDIVWHHTTVTHEDRKKLKSQQPVLLWFTGLSGSGKSTVANAVESKLMSIGRHSYLLDGDNVRHGLNKDLGFTDEDRVENIRRIGEVAKLFVDSGSIVLSAFISPFKSERQKVRDLFEPEQFLEVFIDTPLDVCEQRDPKGLYKKARAGEIPNFTGIDSDYEVPVNPEIVVKTQDMSIEACAEQIVAQLRQLGYLTYSEQG